MFQAPYNNLIVKPKTKYIKHISDILKRASIENNSSVDPVELVNITGEIMSLPKAIKDDEYHKGYSLDGIKVGDIAIFRYDVIFDLVQVEPETPPIYRNMIAYRGEEYFACDIVKLFGVIRGEEIIMVNGYTMVSDFVVSNIVLPAALKQTKGSTKSQLLHIGNPVSHGTSINAKQGEYVYFSPLKAQKYEIAGKKFCILQQNHILGKSKE